MIEIVTIDEVSPVNGGCWYCRTRNTAESLLWSHEFDTFYHKSCNDAALTEAYRMNDRYAIIEAEGIRQ